MAQAASSTWASSESVSGEIYVSKQTIRAQDRILQTRNVSSFGPGRVPRYWFKWRHLIAFGFLGFILFPWSGYTRFVGIVILGVVVWGAFAKHRSPYRHGLVVYMNSGERLFFPTQDKRGLQAVTAHVAALIENMESTTTTAKIKISTKKVSFEDVNVNGILNTGTMSGQANVNNQSSGQS